MAQMSPVDWAKRPIQRYAQFSGRAPRAEYWWFYLAYIIAYIVASIVDGLVGFPVLTLVLSLGLLLPMLAVTVRRLHDTGRTGWWLLAPIVFYVVGLAIGGMALFTQDAGSVASLGAAGIFLVIGGLLAILLLVFMILPGNAGPNRFGADPYGVENLDQVFA